MCVEARGQSPISSLRYHPPRGFAIVVVVKLLPLLALSLLIWLDWLAASLRNLPACPPPPSLALGFRSMCHCARLSGMASGDKAFTLAQQALYQLRQLSGPNLYCFCVSAYQVMHKTMTEETCSKPLVNFPFLISFYKTY